ncbi:MAG: B12-binding domain-containing radical SAM protein [Gemmataceae bacterium]|nr:B12-binding domain-containing radical SAM protein [Gemmataceae bacterium]
MLDVLFVNPASRTQVYQALGTDLAAVENPIWAGLLAGFCRRRGVSAAIVDAEAEELLPEQVAQRVRDYNPRLVAIVVYGHQPSASTQNMTAAGRVCSIIKQDDPNRKVLFIGGHVAALPERTLREEDADFVATGEGLHTVVALIEALRSPTPRFEHVPGLCFRADDGVHQVPDRPLLTNLDAELADLAWDLLPMQRYRAHNWHCLGGRPRQPYAALYTTLGCPFHCSFCCIQAPFRAAERASGLRTSANSYRYWSAEHVVRQIDTLVTQYGVRNLKFADEMFVLNRRHVLRICEQLMERKYDLNIWAYARVDTITDGLLDQLRAAGFTWLALGIEAGSERVRAGVDKKFSQDDVFAVVAKVRAAGINVIGNYIFGLPDDDHESMQATLDLAIELNCEFANFYSAMAYPGSPLYGEALRRGWPLPRAWTGYAQHSRDCLPLPTKYLTSAEVLRFRDEAFVRYFTGARYLKMVASRFGDAAAREIAHLARRRLERDLLPHAPGPWPPNQGPAQTPSSFQQQYQ